MSGTQPLDKELLKQKANRARQIPLLRVETLTRKSYRNTNGILHLVFEMEIFIILHQNNTLKDIVLSIKEQQYVET